MGGNGEYKRQRKGGKKVSPPRASSRQRAGMSKKKPHPPTPHNSEGGNNMGVVREESTPLGPSEAGMQGPRRDEGWGKVATTKGGRRSFATAGQKEIPKGRARPQQGRKATEREGEDPLSPRCQAKEGRGPPLGRNRRGGPAYRQSYLPVYTGKPRQLRQARAGRRNRGK